MQRAGIPRYQDRLLRKKWRLWLSFHLKADEMKAVYIFRIAAALASTILSACASRPSDWRPLSLHLREGMTESQAIAAIGYPPNTTEVVNCGASRGPAWDCRMLYFDSSAVDQQHSLIVYEANHSGTWRVDSWNIL